MMKPLTMRGWLYVVVAIIFVACKNEDSKKTFEISGTITNGRAKTVYLEAVPAGGTSGTIVDSSALAKNGNYKLAADSKESMVYNLRLDQNKFPLAAVINDVPKMTLNVELNKEYNEVAEKYDVKGSPVSQEMKDFMYKFNGDLQKIYVIMQKADSLNKINPADSAISQLLAERRQVADQILDFSLNAIKKANNPALFLFELGYYQSTANEPGFGLAPMDIEQVDQLMTEAVGRFPAHERLKAVKSEIDQKMASMKKSMESKWVGKEAPDFSLPDPSGKQIKLSSFRGKYVLVDFWASWCRPCREENPNVVQAYNKFKDKNFAILGVSLDNPGDKDKWLNAVMKDHLTWTHVSDLKGWESVVVGIYDFGVVGIPYNILVDPEGKVIAERLRGRGLEAKLSEVLK
jgi:peroxiredoxin